MSDNKFDSILANGQLPPPKSVAIESIVDDLWITYVEEVSSLLSRLEEVAMSLESGSKNSTIAEDIAEIKRVLHSIKGDSGMCGVTDVHDLCHELESALDDLQENGYLANVLLKSKDWIEAVIAHLSDINISDEKNKEHEQNLSKQKLKALIVDDDIVCRERLKMLLQDFFDCTFACNGKEGLLIYKKSLEDENPYEMITLDINMPEMDGHQTLEAIRKAEEDHGIGGLDVVKVIMTTSESASNHVLSAFREGCEAYVVKRDMGDKLLEEIVRLGLLKVAKVQIDYVID